MYTGELIAALRRLEGALSVSLLSMVWVILSYMSAVAVLVLTAGRLSDLFGRKQAYVAGFVVFALASLGAGFATDATGLILWRAPQGIRAAFLLAHAPPPETHAFPPEQLGHAMGTHTLSSPVGP